MYTDRIAPPAGWRDDQQATRTTSQPAPNTAYNADTGRWEVPQRRIPQPVDQEDWDLWGDDDDYSLAYCTPSRYRSRTARQQISPRDRLNEEAAHRAIVYAQYDPAFDPDLHAQPVRAAKPKPAKTVPAPQPVSSDDPADGELPPGLSPAAWLAMRHLVSVARKAIADPASVNYVPEAESEQPQLVVTPAGLRYTAKFEYLEIKQ